MLSANQLAVIRETIAANQQVHPNTVWAMADEIERLNKLIDEHVRIVSEMIQERTGSNGKSVYRD